MATAGTVAGMTGPDDRFAALQADVSSLRTRVGRAEDDAAAARTLAGGADRDAADLRTELREFRAQNDRVLNAMREDLTDLRRNTAAEFVDVRAEMRAGFADVRAEMSAGFAAVDFGFAAVDFGFAAVRGRLDATAAGHQELARMLTVLIEREGGAER